MLNEATIDTILLTQCVMEVGEVQGRPKRLYIYVPQALKDGIKQQYESMLIQRTGTIPADAPAVIERDIARREWDILERLQRHLSAGKSEDDKAHFTIAPFSNSREPDYAFLQAASQAELDRYNQMIQDLMAGLDNYTLAEQQEIVGNRTANFPHIHQPALIIEGDDLIATLKAEHGELIKNLIYKH